ncbi:MAG: hypothetical protein H6937_08395 [Burkholderiales bacterium]|nr:hypothetical protein [Burkholderiales bacterium]
MKQNNKQQYHDDYITAKAKVEQLKQQAEAIQQRKADCLTRKAVLGIDLERAKRQSKNDEKATFWGRSLTSIFMRHGKSQADRK